MPKFEDKFVHFRWSDELEGKMVFYADDILTLMNNVASRNVKSIVTFSGFEASPFVVNDDKYATASSCRFVYYDPYYDFKVALEEGKTIQGKNRLTGEWVDMAGKNIDWDNVDWHELRIKPEEQKPVTNRELARWLAKGNGEFLFPEFNWAVFQCRYDADDGDKPVDGKFLVRKWEDKVWHKPTREYMGLEG